MIVASLLLILVAVTLLVLGLTGGSSNLLISSIVASLLAAVALVIGARQAVGARRVAEEGAEEGKAAPDADGAEPFAGAPYAAESYSEEPAFVDARTSFVEPAPTPDPIGPDPIGPDPIGRDPLGADLSGPDPLVEEPARRSRRPETATGDAPSAGSPSSVATVVGGSASAAAAESRDTTRAPAGSAAAPEVSGLADDFGEPDADDPDDEPRPQAVRPTDAVRVARLDAEVLVVDGRPRYHLADCPHLIGRLTEALPVNEAVELGFSPCGRCRPVDRLVGAASRR